MTERVPVFPACSQRVPGTRLGERVPVFPPLLRGTRNTEHAPPNRSSAACSHLGDAAAQSALAGPACDLPAPGGPSAAPSPADAPRPVPASGAQPTDTPSPATSLLGEEGIIGWVLSASRRPAGCAFCGLPATAPSGSSVSCERVEAAAGQDDGGTDRGQP